MLIMVGSWMVYAWGMTDGIEEKSGRGEQAGA